jgi:hypothetical protein
MDDLALDCNLFDACASPSSRMSPLLDWFTLESIYPRYPSIHNIEITELERHSWLDLRPYMDIAPYTIHTGASVQRTYRMFRTLGLRHLIVVSAVLHSIKSLVWKLQAEFNLCWWWQYRSMRRTKWRAS